MSISVQGFAFGRSLLPKPFKAHSLVPSPAVWTCAGQRRPRSLTQLCAQRFTSSTSKVPVKSAESYPTLPSPERIIAETLKHDKHDKWGWVIYRTTYDDDEGWIRFKQIITQNSLAQIADSDTPEIADSLEWTFVEDRATLDGASKHQLRSRFKQWAAAALKIEQPQIEDFYDRFPEAVRTEQPRIEDPRVETFGIPRYTYFIDVDEGALKSVVYDTPPLLELDREGVGYMNFVNADWKPQNQIKSELGLVDDGEEEVHELVEGCTEENVGWVKISSFHVGASFYQAMMGYPDVWYAFYQRPPMLMNW